MDDARRAYIEISNVGLDSINLAQFEIGKIEPWAAAGTTYPAASGNHFMLPAKKLAPGESFLIAMVFDWGPKMFLLAPEDYDPNLTKREMWTLADVKLDFPEAPGGAPNDSVTPTFNTIQFWGGRECVYLRQHISATDSVLIDQINGIWAGTDGTRTGTGNYPPADVAGFTNATRDATLIRKFSVKQGNMDFNTGRGEDLSESEWMPVPHQAGGRWADNVRRLFWTAKNHGPYVLDETSFVPKAGSAIEVDWVANTITVPWGVRRDDSIMFRFDYSKGLAWHYDYVDNFEDSAKMSIQTNDTLIVYACGNTLEVRKFALIVADPTADANIVVPKKAKNANGFYVGVDDPVYTVTDGIPGMDTIGTQRFGGIPFATRIDTLEKYLEKPATATWELVCKNGENRVDLKSGDILRVTGSDGTSVKDYFIKVDKYRPSHNAYLSSITWPDIPDNYRGLFGWMGDTVPNFVATKYNYTVKIPADIPGVPQLISKNQDLNAKVAVSPAVNLFGSLADKTAIFTSTAADDTTIRTYSVQLIQEVAESNIQPQALDPFISEFVWQDQWSNGFMEVVNPGPLPIDLSKYMFSWGYSNTPADAISRLAANTTANWNNRYAKYIPGRRWVDSTTWKVTPAIVVEDINVNPIVAPGDVFVIGDVYTTVQVPARDLVTRNGILQWWATLQCDIELSNGRNPWNEPTYNWNMLQEWNAANWYLFRIENDSVSNGTKPAIDPNDFVLVDVFGSGDGTAYVVGGLGATPQTATYIRKPEIYKGNTAFKGSFGTDEATSEWIRHDRNYYDARAVPWPYDILYITEDLGSHFMNAVTFYKSTVSSSLYKVSPGYTKELIRGVTTGTTLAQLLGNLIKADPGQTLTVKDSATGTVLTDADVVLHNDTLYVQSADLVNTTRYALEVTESGLSADAVVTSATLTVTPDGANGTITGFNYGETLKSVYDQLVIPAGATSILTDANGTYISFKRLNFDTAYVDVMVNDQPYLHVTSENGVNTLVYHFEPNSASTDAFVTSDVFTVDNTLSLIFLVPGGIAVPEFMKNLVPATGASMVLNDKLGNERMFGNVVSDDSLVVTAADGITKKTYGLKMLGGLTIKQVAYVTSEVYLVDQLVPDHTYGLISGDNITNGVTVAAFKANLIASTGATINVTNSQGVPKPSGRLTAGDLVQVVSPDGSVTKTYQIDVAMAVVNPLGDNIGIYPNPSKGLVYVSGLKTGNRISVTNMLGVLVYQKQAVSEKETITLENQRNGIYFITISDTNNVIGRYKVVKE